MMARYIVTLAEDDRRCAAAFKQLCLQQVCPLGSHAQQLMSALRGDDNLVFVCWHTCLFCACKPGSVLIVIVREHATGRATCAGSGLVVRLRRNLVISLCSERGQAGSAGCHERACKKQTGPALYDGDMANPALT